MELEDFFLGPGIVDLKSGEILQEIVVPHPPLDSKQVYTKHSPRRAMDLAVVNVAVCLTLDEKRDACQDVRIALGAVAPTPMRAHQTEEMIFGKRRSEIDWQIVSDIIRGEVNPISDVRGTAEYRTEMVGTLTVQALKRLWSGEPADE
jgi:carbon-monoxide dehydrogenase medium subunit